MKVKSVINNPGSHWQKCKMTVKSVINNPGSHWQKCKMNNCLEDLVKEQQK